MIQNFGVYGVFVLLTFVQKQKKTLKNRFINLYTAAENLINLIYNCNQKDTELPLKEVVDQKSRDMVHR